MSDKPGMKSSTTALQSAVIRFMPNGALEVKVSGISGITARMLDNVSVALYKEVNRLRALERSKDFQARLKAEAEVKAAAEEAVNKGEVK
jgi:hypothetical protein